MELYRKEEYFKIVGICMEIHRIFGGGLLEIVYKDALEYEFKKHNIPFQREKEYSIKYKDIVLAHKFYADFVIYDEIILEVKASKDIIDEYTAQTINYLRLADSDLGIIVNFNKKSLQHKRVIH
ncbi:GxxExxY protein [Flavobacterium collinsii]|uniref:GxxExxY protein n=1 Tax=Flavobacterium collinsii TaxID=1114861 RepID=UPI00375774D4